MLDALEKLQESWKNFCDAVAGVVVDVLIKVVDKLYSWMKVQP